MNQQYSSTLLENAVNEFAKLPGIGRKTALRLVLHLLKQSEAEVDAFGNAFISLRREIVYCKVCHNISDTEVCHICSNPGRDHHTICVVENIKDVMTIDRISDGRVELGLGAGGTGFDADVLGAERLSPAHRADRFEEFVSALDQLLREPVTTYRGRWFSAVESRTLPGCVQQPRVPFTIAAAGPRALGVAARFGSTWVTFGPMTGGDTADDWFEGLRLQTERLNAVCRDHDRAPESLRRMALLGLEQGWATHSVSALSETIDRLEALGFTDVAVHCPRPWDDERPGVPQAVFDAISDRLVV